MEIILVLAGIVAIYLWLRPTRHTDSVPDVVIAMPDDRVQYAEARIKELLRQLEKPYGYWTFANVPLELDTAIDRLLTADAENKTGRALKARMPIIRRECATKMVLMRVQDLSERAELAATVATKQKNAREALLAIEAALSEHVADPVPLREKVPALRRYIAQVEIDGFTEKARRFEFKGNLKKALEYYQDALYSAIHDDVHDFDQREAIDALTAKVEELMATISISTKGNSSDNKRP